MIGKIKDYLEATFGVVFGTLFFLGWFGGVPLALIFGDKWDVVISLFIPFYGLCIAIF